MKEKSAREGRALQAVDNELLRRALVRQKPKRKLELRRPGVDLLDRDKLFDLIDSRCPDRCISEIVVASVMLTRSD